MASVVGLLEVSLVVYAIAARRLGRDHRRLVERESDKSLFLKLAAHELRAPLALVRGYVDILASGTLGQLSSDGGEALKVVDARLRHMEQLIQEMTEAARLQTGHTLLKRDRLEMRELIREAVDRVRCDARPQHRLTLDLPRTAVWLRADHARMLNVLTNLIGNAIKYSPQGGEVRVSLRLRRRSVRIFVRDEGIGIPPEQIGRLFRPFTRLSTVTGIGGTGLGLYLAREITRAHDGELLAVVNLDSGSTFVLTLPLT